MIDYNDLYDLLRKEKYSDSLQSLPKNFLEDFGDFINTLKDEDTVEGDILFSEAKNKKQLENSIALFRELVLKRKKKLLNLAFVAIETGLMKRDFETMLSFEKILFEKFLKAFEEGDKELTGIIQVRKSKEPQKYKMIYFEEEVEQFVDMNGNILGPFKLGSLANIESDSAEILVDGGKAKYVDE